MQQVEITPRAPQPRTESLGRRISDFLARSVSKFRFVLLAVLVAAAAFLLGYFIYNEIAMRRGTESTLRAEGAQQLYDTWRSEQDATKKSALEKDLLDQLDRLIAKYPRQYGGQRGLFIRADVRYRKKLWDEALSDYDALARRFPRSYLAPISLFNAGVCLEEKGDADSAQKRYLLVVGSYKDAAVAPRALFDAGRIDEGKGAFEEAQKRYEALDTEYSQSAWAKLAKNRIIDLKVQGKIK